MSTRAVARLILLNGPPGIGKSTLARRYVDDHPLALNVDIDSIRMSLGQWEEHNEAKSLARQLGAAMAKSHLAGGHHVVVPQLLGGTEFHEILEEVAREAGAQFHEVVLLDTREGALARFRTRRAELATAGVSHPQDEIEPDREAAAINGSYDALLRICELRPQTRVVHTTAGKVDEAYDALCQAIHAGDGSVQA